LPRVVLEFAQREPSRVDARRRLLVASLFLVPMVHNWFVSMGMLDFALGVSSSLGLLVLLARRKRAGEFTWGSTLAIAAVGLLTWYAHVFSLMVVHLLVGIEVLFPSGGLGGWAQFHRGWLRARSREAVLLFVPLLPSTVLMTMSLVQHATEPVGAMTGWVALGKLLPPWELLYNLWAEWLWGFTKLSITSFLPAVVLAWYGVTRARRRPGDEPLPFFSPIAFAVLAGLYAFMPYTATNWFHVNSRFIPYLWVCALLRVPTRLPRRMPLALALAGGLYSVGMGIDYVRLDRDRAEFTAGIPYVPEGARLLPILFKSQVTSENTRSLLHAWGYYVLEKHTAAPLLFAHSRSFPVMYREPPPPRFNHLVFEGFAPSMISPDWMCNVLRSGGIAIDDCDAAWRARWTEFWRDATPRYDHLLMWDAPAEVLKQVPADYRILFAQDRLVILERTAKEAR
jgi:hypothetical protein